MIDICVLFPPFIFSSASLAQGNTRALGTLQGRCFFLRHSVSHGIDRKFINMRSFVVITNVGFICGFIHFVYKYVVLCSFI
jgi:hypothetical protein